LALSYFRPVIATRVGGLPEVIQEGKNGLLVNPENVEELGIALERFFRERMKEPMGAYLKRTHRNSNEGWIKLVRVLSEIALHPQETGK
jgi:glycosyltransferase involved in cell wall biosynthesis